MEEKMEETHGDDSTYGQQAGDSNGIKHCRKVEYDEAGLPKHLPIGVDKNGQGPVSERDPEFVRLECWCGEKNCKKYAEQEYVAEWIKKNEATIARAFMQPRCVYCEKLAQFENVIGFTGPDPVMEKVCREHQK